MYTALTIICLLSLAIILVKGAIESLLSGYVRWFTDKPDAVYPKGTTILVTVVSDVYLQEPIKVRGGSNVITLGSDHTPEELNALIDGCAKERQEKYDREYIVTNVQIFYPPKPW